MFILQEIICYYAYFLAKYEPGDAYKKYAYKKKKCIGLCGEILKVFTCGGHIFVI